MLSMEDDPGAARLHWVRSVIDPPTRRRILVSGTMTPAPGTPMATAVATSNATATQAVTESEACMRVKRDTRPAKLAHAMRCALQSGSERVVLMSIGKPSQSQCIKAIAVLHDKVAVAFTIRTTQSPLPKVAQTRFEVWPVDDASLAIEMAKTEALGVSFDEDASSVLPQTPRTEERIAPQAGAENAAAWGDRADACNDEEFTV